MFKKIICWGVFLLSINIAYGIKVGLDSGHSIKELYKSGGVFTVAKLNEYGNPTNVPYFSLGWPDGGVRVNGIGIPANLSTFGFG